MHPELRDVRHGRSPRVCHHDGQVVVCLVQVLQEAHQGVRICKHRRGPSEESAGPLQTRVQLQQLKSQSRQCIDVPTRVLK